MIKIRNERYISNIIYIDIIFTSNFRLIISIEYFSMRKSQYSNLFIHFLLTEENL